MPADAHMDSGEVKLSFSEVEGDEDLALSGDDLVRSAQLDDADTPGIRMCEESSSRNSVLDLVTIQKGMALLGNDYGAVVDLYFANTAMRIEEFSDALSNENTQSLIRPAHTLKTTSAQIGASKLFYMSMELEKFAKSCAQKAPGRADFLQAQGMIKQIREILKETENTLLQLLELYDAGETTNEGERPC